MFLVDGRVAGTWRRELPKGAASVEVSRFRPLAAPVRGAVAAAAGRFARFPGRDLALSIGGRQARAAGAP